MTLALRALFLFQVLVITAAAQALTVTVTKTDEYCDGANGAMWANVMGGVEPYTYLWSNGATTESIYDLVEGTYSVTVTDFLGAQATDGANILSYASFPPTDMGGARAYCPVGFEYVHTVFSQIGLQESNLSLPMLPPFTLQGVTAIDMLGFGGDQLIIYGPPWPAEGSSSQFTYTDANGCPGEVTLHVGYVVDFPVMSLLNVDAACASAANGVIQVALTAEGHDQPTELELKRSNGQIVETRYVGYQTSIETFSGLVPDDYWLVQRIRSVGNDPVWQQLRNACGDSLMVTVADLGANCGNVNGTVYMDYNEDCIMGNSSETRVPGAVLEFTPGPYYATANSGGGYSVNLPAGALNMQQIATGIAQHCPAPPAVVNVSGVQTINVGDTALVPLDAEVMIASGFARPGFMFSYVIQQRNLTPATTGAMTTVMTFDPAAPYVIAYPGPNSIVGNTLTWNQSALGAFQQRSITVVFQVPPDVGLIGTVLNASVSISTANTDAAVANNSTSTAVTITGSFDPNDKTALTSSQWSNELYYIDVDNWIDYTIRFQNTGTDTAFTVIITDTLPATLDPATIQWGAASHSCMRSLVGQGVVKHIFPNILLPDSNVNEPASHGFASFRIRPRLPLEPATVIENVANIFFDFNPPVITPPSVLVAEFSTTVGRGEPLEPQQLLLSPVPVSHELIVSISHGDIAHIRIVAMDGREVLSRQLRASRTRIDLSDLASGPYVAIALDDEGKVHHRPFIKQ